jgi:hypothetical protein
MTPIVLTKKIKQCEPALLRKEVKNFAEFPTCVKLGQDPDPDRHQTMPNNKTALKDTLKYRYRL